MPGPQNPLVHDLAVRQRFLDLIRSGSTRYNAAAGVGLSPDQYRYAYKNSPEFRDELEDALNASVEPVIEMLRKKALTDGDVNAAKEYLKHTAPPPRGAQQTVTHKVEIELPADLSDIAALSERVRMRKQAIEIEETTHAEVPPQPTHPVHEAP